MCQRIGRLSEQSRIFIFCQRKLLLSLGDSDSISVGGDRGEIGVGSRHIVGCLLYLGMQLSSIETKQGLIWSNLIARMHQNSQNSLGYGIRNIELLARIED